VTGLAWHTARARAASLAGSFVALALGVALLAAMALTLASTAGTARHPRWFARAGVVAYADTVSVTSGSGDDRETETATTAEHARCPPPSPRGCPRLHAAAVLDYAGYASARGAPGDTVHPGGAASLHHYTWVSGGPPAGPGQLVLTAPTRLGPGGRIVLLTADGQRRFTVSGVIRTGAQAAFYTTDAVAARLAGGRIDAVALTGPPGAPIAVLAAQARAAARGQPVRVLTGDHRRDAEPDPDAGLFAVAASLLGTTSGLAGFVAVFVVASTFAYAVAARRREFGLLRSAGATPRQIRRLVLGEALAVGVLASAVGGALGIVIAPPFARWLARSGIAPPDFTAHIIVWPVAVAFAAGLVIALVGAWLAARRAGRVRPAEALREAAVDRRPMTVSRWAVGVAALGGSVALAGIFATAHSADAASLILLVAMLLVFGCAMLAPVLIPRWCGLTTCRWPPCQGDGRAGQGGAVTTVRRTAATVAPVCHRRLRRIDAGRARYLQRHRAERGRGPDHRAGGRDAAGRGARARGSRRRGDPGGARRRRRGPGHGHDGLRALRRRSGGLGRPVRQRARPRPRPQPAGGGGQPRRPDRHRDGGRAGRELAPGADRDHVAG
jgi:putative ABC transport system permease protein